MLTERKRLAMSGALALAMGLVVGVSIDGSDKPSRDAMHEAIGSALAAGSATASPSDKLDAKAYHQAMIEARAEDPTAIDLLTAPVEPGTEVTTAVTLSKGQRTTGVVEYIGPHAASFTTTSVTHIDGETSTRVEVKARNNGAEATRLVGLIHVIAP